jgi:mRNA-degrading endonuclease toxin of MazEF toxin-antitoxin module
MPLPEPRLGLVLSYAFLWHDEHRAGRDEAAKARPCVIVLALRRESDGTVLVRVVPVTHSPPKDPGAALELPQAVKRHLGLDASRSWVILDELNELTWPGFDLRPIALSPTEFAYGFLPPRLFDTLIIRLRQVWSERRGKATRRD